MPAQRTAEKGAGCAALGVRVGRVSAALLSRSIGVFRWTVAGTCTAASNASLSASSAASLGLCLPAGRNPVPMQLLW